MFTERLSTRRDPAQLPLLAERQINQSSNDFSSLSIMLTNVFSMDYIDYEFERKTAA